MADQEVFECASSAEDVLDTHTFVKGGGDSVFSLTIIREDGRRANVMLDIEACQRLRDQLNTHISDALLTPAL